MLNALAKAAYELGPQMVAWRRWLHAHPELSGEERDTAAYVAAELRKMGLEPAERIGGTYGLTATLGPPGGAAVALRADMDALPIQEETGLEYASKNAGVMHACGHDSHTAMLLGAARLLVEHQNVLSRRVILIFQPHEERYPGGAQPMIAAGVLEGVESAFGLHIWSLMPAGYLATRVGPLLASVNNITAVIHGKGGHAAMPENCIDPVVVAAHVITALQTVVSRALGMNDQGVVSITRVNAGTADNIIPEQATLSGTIRTLSEAVRERMVRRVREIIEGVASAHGARADVEIAPGYPVTVNEASAVARALRAAREIGFDNEHLIEAEPIGGGEDFAYYGQKVPAAFAFLGGGNEAKGCTFPHHHPRFNIDEDVLPKGAALLAQYALLSGSD